MWGSKFQNTNPHIAPKPPAPAAPPPLGIPPELVHGGNENYASARVDFANQFPSAASAPPQPPAQSNAKASEAKAGTYRAERPHDSCPWMVCCDDEPTQVLAAFWGADDEQRAREYVELMTESYGHPLESHQNAWKAVSDTIQERDQLREQLEQLQKKAAETTKNCCALGKQNAQLREQLAEVNRMRAIEQKQTAEARDMAVKANEQLAAAKAWVDSMTDLLGTRAPASEPIDAFWFADRLESLRSKLAERAGERELAAAIHSLRMQSYGTLSHGD